MASKNNRNSDEGSARDRLLREATTLFAQNGYAGTSIREIVAQAGVTKPVLYYYFGSKEGLFRAIVDEAAARQKFLFEEVVSAEGTSWDRINFLCKQVYNAIQQNRDLMRMIHGSVFGPDKSSPAYNFIEFRNRAMEAIKQLCLEGINNGEFTQGEPTLMAQLLLAIMDSSIFIDLTFSDDDRPERIGQLLALAFEGLSKRDFQYA